MDNFQEICREVSTDFLQKIIERLERAEKESRDHWHHLSEEKDLAE